jgi:hypothetical protein
MGRKAKNEAEIEARFWVKVTKGLPTDCWLWNGGTTGHPKHDYGVWWYKGKHLTAHDVSYILTHGDIPESMVICHTCDNPKCVNPNHLWAGTHKDNYEDMVAKKRQKYPSSKLTSEKVVLLRQRFGTGESRTALAKEYGISREMLYRVCRRDAWVDVE